MPISQLCERGNEWIQLSVTSLLKPAASGVRVLHIALHTHFGILIQSEVKAAGLSQCTCQASSSCRAL